MKKMFLFFVLVMTIIAPAVADGVVTETETVTTVEVVEYNYNAPRYVSSAQVVPHKRPCAKKAMPVRVKTHTEVIDHYQLYQPVTIYQPAGRVSTRRIIRAPQVCNKCY